MSSSQIPIRTQVLVIGGGPGGSYAAAALAREHINVVLLEADTFPRYHIGESMLASMRHLLRFIDLDAKFDKFGFTKKVGAAFKLNGHKREGFTDFLAAGGPENYAWNVIRSEADNLMFEHARECGALTFDGTKVTSISFAEGSDPARPISAQWKQKATGTEGEIAFDYIIDASGRIGILSTKYLKNRHYNLGLKNIANWGYWTGCGAYAVGTARANSPFFEALKDESGWAWLIPLHNGTTSVGVVMNQEIAMKKKQAVSPSPSTEDFYLSQLELAPSLRALIGDGKLKRTYADSPGEVLEEDAATVPVVRSASDYSYSASSYAGPGYRIVGDAGAFIDPYFSSGVHLALTGALSAAATICSAIRGEVDETTAAKWHSDRVAVSYTRFLLVVLSAYKQIRAQEQPVLADFDEDNFDRAFAFFRPVIQGTADVSKHLSQDELSKTLEFCAHAFEPTQPEDREAVMKKLNSVVSPAEPTAVVPTDTPSIKKVAPAFDENLSKEEERVLKHINARKMMRTEETINITSFSTDVINGLRPRLEAGNLGLAIAVGA